MNSHTLALALILSISPCLCRAQSDDLNQLKTRVTQLEQMVQELKARLASGRGPNSIEYWGPPGMVFFRTVQSRWASWHSGDANFICRNNKPGRTLA